MFSVLDEIVSRNFEEVCFFQDSASGIFAIVAIHDSTLGPALGGCRMLQYDSLERGLHDVVRLAEGMTFKNSLAGLNLGGGKSVIIADRTLQNGRRELFQSFGHFVKSLGGRYYTAEDMGTSVSDMNYVLETCPFVAGRDPLVGGGGDPSPYTARGVFEGMKACLERAHGTADFSGRTIAIQGVGHVGKYLVRHLAEAGAKLILADTRPAVLQEVATEFGADAISVENIMGVECDIFSPCAVGGILTHESVARMKTKIVAGGANNQLKDPSVEEALVQKGILYAPDFAINAGGVILCADELEPGGFTEKRVLERVLRIGTTVGKIIDESRASGDTPGKIAVRLAKQRIAETKAARVRPKS